MSATQEKLDNAAFGGQRALIVTSASVGTLKLADYPRLKDQTALQDGTYYCRIDIGGLSAINLHLTATFTAGTVTTSGGSTYLVGTQSDATLAAAPYQYQSLVGVGAMTTATKQDLTISATLGEQYVILKIVISGTNAAGVTFSQAEINGPR